MKTSSTKRSCKAALHLLLITVGVSLAGCAAYTQSTVPPGSAASVLQVGDEIEVTRNDGSTAYFEVEEIGEEQISGSLLTNMFGRNVSIPYTDIASITLYTKDGRDSEQTAAVVGGILGLALFLSLL